jgi:TRAP-type uncharacterized transport system fused permease subunit
MGFAVVLAFLLYSASNRSPMDRPSIIDILAIIMGVVVCGYAALNYDRIMMNPGISNEWDLVLGIIATFLVLEMTRRILSWILPAIAVLTILYAYFGQYLPDTLPIAVQRQPHPRDPLHVDLGLWGP